MKILLLSFSLLLCQCTPLAQSARSEKIPSAAENKIMTVSSQPVSLGYIRCATHARQRPEFGQLLERIGMPDCMAEKVVWDKHYLVMYYLNARNTYSCRFLAAQPHSKMEVSGPYPMTKNEHRTLSNFAQQAPR